MSGEAVTEARVDAAEAQAAAEVALATVSAEVAAQAAQDALAAAANAQLIAETAAAEIAADAVREAAETIELVEGSIEWLTHQAQVTSEVLTSQGLALERVEVQQAEMLVALALLTSPQSTPQDEPPPIPEPGTETPEQPEAGPEDEPEPEPLPAHRRHRPRI